MRRRFLSALLAVVAMMSGAGMVAAGPPSPPPSAPGGGAIPATGVLSPRRAPRVVAELVGQVRLENGLLAVLRDPRFAGAESQSCLVVERGDERIFAHQPAQPVIPASTLKMVTGWAALRRFGSGHRFVTEVRADGPPRGGVVERLWLVGGGDPLLSTADYAAHFANQPQTYTSLDELADRVRAAGVVQVTEGVYGDDGRFDGLRYLPSWKDGYISDNEVGPIGALVVNDNFTTWRPRPVAASDPAAHGASVLRSLLADRGVAVAGDGARGTAPGRSTVIARVTSAPLTAVVGEMLAESDNLTAEVLVKALGREFGAGGTWEAGLAVVRSTLAEAGLPVDQLRLFDGSGLERDNRVSCELLIGVLDDPDLGPALAAGLPVAGESGTLRLRLDDPEVKGRVRAKTGSIDYVAGLVGYAESAAGTLEFALVGNGLPRAASAGRDFADAVARVLVRYPAVPPVTSLEPLPPRATTAEPGAR